jgi:NADH dehydrogenase
VQEIADDKVSLSDGTVIATHCVVWAGGLQARSFDGLDAVDRGRGGRLTAGADLSLDGFPGVYAVGDVANVRAPDGEAYPQLGSVAMQAGGAVAASISARIAGSPPPGFHYHDKGIMAMIGRHAAVAELGSHHHELHGPVAFSAWLGVHAWLMSSNRARIDSFISWAWDAFSKNRMPGFIDAPDEPRIDWGDRDEAPASDSAATDDTSAGNPKGTP